MSLPKKLLKKLKARIVLRLSKLLGHKTNASGNNMSQR